MRWYTGFIKVLGIQPHGSPNGVQADFPKEKGGLFMLMELYGVEL